MAIDDRSVRSAFVFRACDRTKTNRFLGSELRRQARTSLSHTVGVPEFVFIEWPTFTDPPLSKCNWS